MNLIWAAVAGFLSGVNTEQALAQGINLLFFIPCAIVAVFMHAKKKLINFKIAIPLALIGLVGASIGSYIACFLSSRNLSKIFAVLLLIMSVFQLAKNRK